MIHSELGVAKPQSGEKSNTVVKAGTYLCSNFQAYAHTLPCHYRIKNRMLSQMKNQFMIDVYLLH